MAEESKQCKGKSNFILRAVLVIVAAAVVWGMTKAQVSTNAKGITELKNKKLDKAIFDMHRDQQKVMADRTYGELKDISSKLDRALEKNQPGPP